MKKKLFLIFLAVSFVFATSISVFANSEDGYPDAVQNISSPQSQVVINTYGTDTVILQIPASAFVPRTGSYNVVYDLNGYMHPASSGMWWAPVTLPSGVEIYYLDLYYYDTNSGSDITAYLTGYSGGDWYGNPPAVTDFVYVSSSGSGGYGYEFSPLFSHTVNNNVAYGGGYQYVINVFFPVADGTLQFKGVDLWWRRQISPAPSTATFSDVPTTHPFFQEIEALAASGIATGYPDGTFRPSNYVTRQAMAAFLARALGLHWPY